MVKPRTPAGRTTASTSASSNIAASISGASAIYSQGRTPQRRGQNPQPDRQSIAKPWQYEAYRQINICGEARFAATLFASLASRAEIGVSEPNALRRKAVWVTSGREVDALNELAPTVRERTKLIRDYMLHRTIAGECYLIARDRQPTDPEYNERRSDPVWEIVAVTELRKTGVGENAVWSVRHDNQQWIDLAEGDPVIRMWNPDPEDRREAWSPFRSLLPTLREIEWLTKHIFTQVKSRLMSAGVWFLPENLTFPPPPPDAVEGGEQAIAQMNEAEQFMVSLAASSMQMLDDEEVSFPSVVMADAAALGSIEQDKLIQFWSDIDDKAMTLRSDAVRRFALGMDLPPEQVLGSSGVAVSGAGGSAGSVNHWGEWANEEKTIAGHIEPALDDLVDVLTTSFLRNAVDGTDKVIAYDGSGLRMKQDRSKEAIQWYQMGVLKASVALRETGFDPENDMMDDTEHRLWLLNRIAGGSATPEQVQAALTLLGAPLPDIAPPSDEADERDAAASAPATKPAPELPGRTLPPSLEDNPVTGPPQGDHDHNPAPYALNTPALVAASEVLVLRALEKAGNRLLNDGKRGKDRDRTTPVHLAHCVVGPVMALGASDFDFGLAQTVFAELPAVQRARIESRLARYCASLYAQAAPYTREGLIEALS